jgi:two-component system chemotaxis response regulator CheV
MGKKEELLPKILKTGVNEVEVIDFRMHERLKDGSTYEWAFGVNFAKVREVIMKPDNIVKTPEMPSEVEGMAKIRDHMVPIVDLAKWLKIDEAAEGRYVIVMEFLREIVGIVVHEAKRTRRIEWSDIKKPPASANDKLNGKVVGVIEIEDEKMLLVLDFEAILDELGMIQVFGTEGEFEADGKEGEQTFNILVLDDSPIARKIMRQILEKDGHKVSEVESGIEGLEFLENMEQSCKGKPITECIDLVISDIEMPGMDGFTFVRKVKEDPRFKALPVIINSSLSDRATIAKSKLVNADAHLVKFDAPDLLKLVHKYAIKHPKEEH